MNCLPIYQNLSAEELGKDFRLFYYHLQNAYFNKACRGNFVHCGSDEQVAVLCLPFEKSNNFITSIHDFLTFTTCLVYVKNRGGGGGGGAFLDCIRHQDQKKYTMALKEQRTITSSCQSITFGKLSETDLNDV